MAKPSWATSAVLCLAVLATGAFWSANAFRTKIHALIEKKEKEMTKCVAEGTTGASGMMISWGSERPIAECGPTRRNPKEGLTYKWHFSNAFSVSFDTKCVCSIEGKEIVSFKAINLEQAQICAGNVQEDDPVIGIKKQCWEAYERARGTRFHEVGSMKVAHYKLPWLDGNFFITKSEKCVGDACNSIVLPGVLDGMPREDKRIIGDAIKKIVDGKKSEVQGILLKMIEVLPPEALDDIEFEQIDEDGDSSLILDELTDFYTEFDPTALESFLDELDDHGNGIIAREDFVKLKNKMRDYDPNVNIIDGQVDFLISPSNNLVRSVKKKIAEIVRMQKEAMEDDEDLVLDAETVEDDVDPELIDLLEDEDKDTELTGPETATTATTTVAKDAPIIDPIKPVEPETTTATTTAVVDEIPIIESRESIEPETTTTTTVENAVPIITPIKPKQNEAPIIKPIRSIGPETTTTTVEQMVPIEHHNRTHPPEKVQVVPKIEQDCEADILKLGTNTMGRLMGAEQCGVEQTQIVKEGKVYSLTSAAKKILCSADCADIAELAEPLGNIQELRQQCTDDSSKEKLMMAALGHAISSAIWQTWSSCHGDAPKKPPVTTTTTTIAKPLKKGWVDLSKMGMFLAGHLMSCGPTTDRYIDGMLGVIHDVGLRIKRNKTHDKRKKTKYLTCMASCAAVYSKFSECYYLDDTFKCNGYYTAGYNIGPSGDNVAKKDTCNTASYKKSWVGKSAACDSGWLERPRGDKNLRCNSLYDSRKKSKSAASWISAVKNLRKLKLKVLAAKNKIFFGPFTPVGSKNKVPLDCRNTWCSKVDRLSIQVDKHERTLASCAAECETRNLDME